MSRSDDSAREGLLEKDGRRTHLACPCDTPPDGGEWPNSCDPLLKMLSGGSALELYGVLSLLTSYDVWPIAKPLPFPVQCAKVASRSPGRFLEVGGTALTKVSSLDISG